MHPRTLTLILGAATAGALAEPAALTNLRAAWRHGQVFLTWQESGLPEGATVNVLWHTAPITAASLPQARRLVERLDASSARDWWQDPASFSRDGTPAPPQGWLIETGAAPLDPAGGLFVHTVTEATAGPGFFAVTWTAADGGENTTVEAGRNATAAPTHCEIAPRRPIWQSATGSLPDPQSCSGRRLVLSLHGRGGGATAGERAAAVNCLWFADAEEGWRPGLPFKFHLAVQPDTVVVTPMDRVWIGRPLLESPDQRDHCPAVSTWWYGYNQRIRETTDTDPVVAPNYTQRYLVSLIRWAQQDLGCDVHATYVRGGSMGGSGAVALALEYPQVFAAVHAQVPVYAMTRRGAGSIRRLECACGALAGKTALTGDGRELLQVMDGAGRVRAATVDLPPIFATNGRRDGSIPWENNPPFYQAANEARQAFAVFWNNGQHDMSSQAPADVKDWSSGIFRYRLDQSYPAFSNCSDNRNHGSGDPADGDLEGWINRGLRWRDIEDEPTHYAITVEAEYPGIAYPIRVDLTPRRRRHFRPAPGTTLGVRLGNGPPMPITVGADGLFTIPGLTILAAEGMRVHVTPAAEP